MKINWVNIGGWARTLGTVAAAIQAAVPATSKIGLYCAIAVAVCGEVVKQISNPESWPQRGVVAPAKVEPASAVSEAVK